MSKEEILEGNKLIAEFMGAEVKDNTYCFHLGNPAYQIQIEQMSFEPIGRLQYHSSWDWLMPVVEKIAKSKYPVYLYFSHIQNSCIVHELNNDIAIIRESESSRLESPLLSAYKAVIEFIKWHNQNLTK